MPRQDKTLTKRDLAYLKLAIQGRTNNEIAERMNVSDGRVVTNTYSRIMKTLGYQTLRQMWFELGRQTDDA